MKIKNKIVLMFFCTIVGTAIVILLFNRSENIIHYANTFIRRFPQHVAQEKYKADLGYNSYYFAGSSNGKIYLGNSTAPLQVMELDTALTNRKTYKIIPNNKKLPFHSPKVKVFENNFYLFEGNVPYIFKGNIHDWNAKLVLSTGKYFSHLEPIDKDNVAVRFIDQKTGKSILGTTSLSHRLENHSEQLLQTQIDGIFDVDGSLHFDNNNNRIVYVYRYRNQYIVAHKNLKLDYRGNTIDTINKVQIKVAEVKSKNINTFSNPPLIVNKMSAVSDNLLYVNSNISGQYERDQLWKEASIIDVYDLRDHSYKSSFPIYKIGKSSMNSFTVVNKKLYAIIDDKIVCYKLLNHLTTRATLKNDN
ncbi:hypothetical protein [Flavobacterium algoritolerans]|uniref:DKNYY family protein n=1 Tax=Flavobacterium algoritolerans TaxID=3041254 RepID=A0ABT6VBG9_9FLAO|nr:hypothetical protein [Flavobacterium algoritolerans]MDI5894813.1 hypothetical protein [Flavobacterium algoritolerans]